MLAAKGAQEKGRRGAAAVARVRAAFPSLTDYWSKFSIDELANCIRVLAECQPFNIALVLELRSRTNAQRWWVFGITNPSRSVGGLLQ